MNKMNLLLGMSILFIGCAASHSVPRSRTNSGGNVARDPDKSALNLADFLRKVPGVRVMGSSNNIVVNIHGTSSFHQTSVPLFVIDGQPAGTNYSKVNNMVDVRSIDHVKVLKGSDAAIYGMRGGNGVIEIFTKKN